VVVAVVVTVVLAVVLGVVSAVLLGVVSAVVVGVVSAVVVAVEDAVVVTVVGTVEVAVEVAVVERCRHVPRVPWWYFCSAWLSTPAVSRHTAMSATYRYWLASM